MDVAFKISPDNIMSDWGYVQDWNENGNSAAPTGWSMVGTAGSVARESTEIKFGTYSMKITAGATGTYAAEYLVPNSDNYAGRTISFGMWVKCSTANKARIYINDGSTTTYSSYHTGDGTWQFLTVTVQIDAANGTLKFGAVTTNNAIVAYFSGGVAVEGETIFRDLRSTNYYLREDDVSPSINVRATSYTVPRKDGAVIEGEVQYEDRVIDLDVQLWGETYSDVRTNYDSLVKSFWGGRKDFYIADDRLYKVYLTDFGKPEYRADLRVHRVRFRMTAPNAAEQYIARTRKKQTISSSPTSFNLSYLGNVPSLPLILIVPTGATMDSCLFENQTTGERFTYNGEVPVGTTLLIDCENAIAYVGDVVGTSQFIGDFIKLVPGTNYLKFTGDNNVCRIDWFDRYL